MSNNKTWRGEPATGTNWKAMTLAWVNSARSIATLQQFFVAARKTRRNDWVKMLGYVGISVTALSTADMRDDLIRRFYAVAQTVDLASLAE